MKRSDSENLQFELDIDENVALDAIRELNLTDCPMEDRPFIVSRLGIRRTPISLEFSSSCGEEEWVFFGQELKRAAGGVSWYIGDWLNYGKYNFPNRYELMVDATALKKHNLETIVSVARKFSPDRRRVSLTFGHHARVVALSPQDQEKYLSLAETEKWSTARLYKEIKKDFGARNGTSVVGPPLIPPYRGLLYAPIDEQGVVFLFALMAKDLGFLVERVQTGFPDCIAKRETKPGRWQQVKIEFEYESRNFSIHGHSADGCNIIVCWRDNWPDHPKSLEVVALEAKLNEKLREKLKALSDADGAKQS